MIISGLTYTQKQLNDFAAKQWTKTLNYLQNQYSLSRSDCEDIFQDSFLILYHHILDGKLDKMTSSLSTYFIGICRNKALEQLRSKSKEINLIDDFHESIKDGFEDERIDRLIALEENSEQIETRKSALTNQIVKDLPDPCDKILWGFYRDGFSLQTLAKMLNYKSEGTVKVTKHRCCDKFKNRFKELVNQLFD